MKRLLSILFACILCFSLFGYRLVIDVLQQKAENVLTAKINTGVNEQDLLSLKLPATLPYYTNSKDFQYTDGEVQIDGVVYKYVKRRIYNDSIEYLCLQDAEKTKMLSAREQFYQLAYDLQIGKEKSNNHRMVIKPLLLEYCPCGKAFSLQVLAPTHSQGHDLHVSTLPLPWYPAPVQPPEYNCDVTMC